MTPFGPHLACHLIYCVHAKQLPNDSSSAAKGYLNAATDAGYHGLFTLDSCENDVHLMMTKKVLQDAGKSEKDLQKFMDTFGRSWFFCQVKPGHVRHH